MIQITKVIKMIKVKQVTNVLQCDTLSQPLPILDSRSNEDSTANVRGVLFVPGGVFD